MRQYLLTVSYIIREYSCDDLISTLEQHQPTSPRIYYPYFVSGCPHFLASRVDVSPVITLASSEDVEYEAHLTVIHCTLVDSLTLLALGKVE